MSATHKTVPREPTEEMLDAAVTARIRLYPSFPGEKPEPTAGEVAATIYRAMIEAATEPPATSDAMRERIVAVLDAVANASALRDVRSLVAGWNGEGKPGAPFERHPARLGARIETNCGAIYALDEALVAARALLAELTATGGK